jgi:uncharacterized caspase-like protein
MPIACRLVLALILLLGGLLPVRADAPLKGVALVIGQSAYETLTPLPNPERDAKAIEDLLDRLGFETELARDENTRKLRRSLDLFIEDAEGADVALVYYSGHGIEAGGINYLIPTDAGPAALEDADAKLISLQDVLERLRTKARITILLLDACRSNPFPPGIALKRGPASAGQPILSGGLGAPRGASAVDGTVTALDSLGEVIGFAAEPGQVALDGPADGNSPYAAALLKHFGANAAYEFGDVMTMVTEEVYLATGTRQKPWTNASLRRLLTFGGGVSDSSSDEMRLVGDRRQLLLAIAATPQDMRARLEDLARDQALPLDPLYGMLRSLAVDTVSGPEDIEKQIRAGAENLKKLLADNKLFAERMIPLRDDAELMRLSALGDKAEAQGSIALAQDYRAEASRRADELSKTLDQREAEIAATRLALAATYAKEAGTAILAFDYRLAAAKYEQAYLQAKDDAELASWYRLRQASALYNHGQYKGDADGLRQATDLYEAALGATSRENNPVYWAAIQNDLGNALSIQGERDGDVGALARAVAAYEAALTVWTKESAPADWARTQDNLGSVFAALSERNGDAEDLSKAAAAYQAALTVRTREHTPLDWAQTQTNLGTVLRLEGERSNDPLTRLDAILAYQAALTIWTAEREPFTWAVTQSNLGNVLLTFAQIGDTESLTQAIDAYKAALTRLTRADHPAAWAMLQNNLGSALTIRGEGETSTDSLTEAIAAFELALAERTVERMPMQWARTQYNLGLALKALGQKLDDTEKLTQAIAAFQAALSQWTEENARFDWAAAHNNLGRTQLVLGQRRGDKALLEQSRQSLDLAWRSYKSAGRNEFDDYFSGSLNEVDAALAGLR